MYISKSDEPKIAKKDYMNIYNVDVVKERFSVQDWYFGSEIKPDEHPLRNHINFDHCSNCQSKNVKVIAAQWCVSYHSGNAYWDYEIIFEECGMYTQNSYAEND